MSRGHREDHTDRRLRRKASKYVNFACRKINFNLRSAKAALAPSDGVLYFGGIGYQNIGDELLLSVAQSMFESHRFSFLPNTTITRFSTRTLNRPRGIGAFLGGGTFIGRGKSFEWFGENAKRTGKGIIFGAGVPSHELWSRGGLPQMSDGHLIEDILPACQFVGVRGPDSAARLKQLGFDCKITSDPVFFLSQGNDYWQPEEKTIGLNVGIDDGGPVLGEAEQITQACADALLSYAQKGWKIKVFVVRPSDQVAAMQVLQTLPTSSVEVMSFYTDHMAYLDEVRTTRAFIGYKMHATALAICAGVPSLMLEYRPKCRDLMRSISQDHNCIHGTEVTAENLSEHLDRLLGAEDTHDLLVEKTADAKMHLLRASEEVSQILSA